MSSMSSAKKITIGVLAVQGAFIEHEHMLQSLGVDCIEIRKPEHLEQIDGIILPGGESTVQGQLLRRLDMLVPLQDMDPSRLTGPCHLRRSDPAFREN